MTPVFPSSSVETQPVVSAHRYHQTNGGHVDEERISSQDVNQLGNWDRLLEQMGFDGAPVNLSFEDECDDVLRGRKHDTVAISDEKEYIPTQFPSAGNSQEILYRLVCDEGGKKTFRYSWLPFKGLQQDDRERCERRDLAILDIDAWVEGEHLKNPPRKSQRRKTFSVEDPEEFSLDVDFRARTIYPTRIRVHSPYIQNVLRALIRYYPGYNIQDHEMTFVHPFKELFHYWDDLHYLLGHRDATGQSEAAVHNSDTGSQVRVSCDETTCKHLQTLLTAPPVQEAWDNIVKPELDLYSSGRASYDFLWLLFKPGDIVFLRSQGSDEKLAGFVVMDFLYLSFSGRPSPLVDPHPTDRWQLTLWNLAYDNGRLRRRARIIYVNRFYGVQAITDLAAFPTKFAPDPEALRSQLIKRGRRYYRIICDEQSYMRYNGFIISDKPYHYQGDIIVDHQSYMLEALDSPNLAVPDVSGEEPQDLHGEPLFSKFNDMECSAANELDPAHYLLLPVHVLGFALGKREWAIFDMSFVEDLVIDSNPMKHLIMSQEKQEMIEAVAGSPRKGTALKPWTTDWSADFIEGKGRGRVIFLHGSPGTGKTMTVELIAKKTRRPLLSLSVADLGTEEVQMEKRLMKWLSRAAIWGAIVLIDEAEVYMEQREPGQTGRNALVTAFLRSMEYFPGLLFLTSNGIGLFDEAVMSRIHLAVQYERPTDAERTEIWRRLFDKLEQDQESGSESSQTGGSAIKPTIVVRSTARDVVLSKEQYPTNLKLNGRDIRNLLLSAISLARHRSLNEAVDGKPPKKIEVMAKDLEAVLKNKEQFNDHYKEATGSYPDEMAAQKYFRGESKS
ncbi:AAA domain-containing protein [Fusarium keratoplasticum]|uniref:AAA domain-containing protein n=1 Tax=Fusarium keratoplasticum TaxID=1328300 RepID=A0ACC0R3E9_9HYPO|nr:AAA domain-containing protein [Fusarium keratoplasticum]KAI8674623.1 AAA domain-containing protein [Fusarium keratoplasticum]